MATYYGYTIGKAIGYSKGYDYGAGDTLIRVATNVVGGVKFHGKVYEINSTETTEEELLSKDPSLIFEPGVGASTIPAQ